MRSCGRGGDTDTDDQARRRDQSIIGAEHSRPKPTYALDEMAFGVKGTHGHSFQAGIGGLNGRASFGEGAGSGKIRPSPDKQASNSH